MKYVIHQMNVKIYKIVNIIFCLSCLQMYLNDKIRNGCPALLECPHTDCKQVMHPNDIRRILNDNQMYERYENIYVKTCFTKNA